jgi:hypothetical protein
MPGEGLPAGLTLFYERARRVVARFGNSNRSAVLLSLGSVVLEGSAQQWSLRQLLKGRRVPLEEDYPLQAKAQEEAKDIPAASKMAKEAAILRLVKRRGSLPREQVWSQLSMVVGL